MEAKKNAAGEAERGRVHHVVTHDATPPAAFMVVCEVLPIGPTLSRQQLTFKFNSIQPYFVVLLLSS